MRKIQNYNKKIYLFLSKKIDNKNITLLNISEKIGISQSAVSQQLKRLSDGKGVMTDTLFKIMLALEIEPTELFK